MNQDDVLKAVRNPERLAALQQTELLDSEIEEAFDRLTRLASKITDSPVSLVSLVDADRQFFKSAFGLPEPVASGRETPLSHSFCKHVAATGKPLVVEDARQHPLVKDNLAVSDFSLIGYLGMPLTTTEGVELGSFCVIDTQPRQWTEREIEIVRELSLSTMAEIKLRQEIKSRKAAEVSLQKQNQQYKRMYHFAKTTLTHMKTTMQHGSTPKEIITYIEQMETQLIKLDA